MGRNANARFVEHQTTTPGLEVTVAGAPAGRTPLTMSLAPGSYRVQVGTAGQQRDLDVTIAAGATVQHFLDVASVAPATESVSLGSLQVQTDVPAMAVLVDGVERGHSPLTITDLTPGDHQVLVRADQRSVRRTVSVKAGETLSLVISSIAPAAAVTGLACGLRARGDATTRERPIDRHHRSTKIHAGSWRSRDRDCQ